MLTVEQAGIDTASFAWSVPEDGAGERALRALASARVARGWALPEKVDGWTVGWFPAARLAFAEGHPGGDALGCADELPAVHQRVQTALLDRGIRLGRVQGVRRCDSTLDLRFDRAADGLAVLAGVAAVLGQAHTVVHRDRGRIETVELKGRSGRKTLGRWYDKGIESGLHPRGVLIRPEDQRRYTKATRRAAEELSTAYVRGKLHQRFAPLWRASEGVTVTGPLVLASKLADAMERGDITPAMAERLAGYATLDAAGISAGSRWTGQRRRAHLRDLGLVLADLGLDEVEVDLHDVLERVMDEAAWEPRHG